MSSESTYERELQVAREAAAEATRIISGYARAAIESWDKAEDHPVTQADLEANAAILSMIQEAFPADAIRSEEAEFAGPKSAERVWLIDPLDGTKEFIAGIPEYAVSIGLTLRGEPVVSAVSSPAGGESFWAVRGGGAWLDGERLRISTPTELEKVVLLASRSEIKRGQFAPHAERFGRIEPVGSAAIKLAWVAAGRGDAWLSLAPKNEWDVCGGDLLVREAGGVFVELASGARRYNLADPLLTSPLAAASPAIVEQLSSAGPWESA